MGFVKHTTIVVTDDEGRISVSHSKAIELLGNLVSPIIHTGLNGYSSYFIAPEGSYRRCKEAAMADENRKKFLDWMDENYHGDYFEADFGGDTESEEITRSRYKRPATPSHKPAQ